jgi:hypothetical protein
MDAKTGLLIKIYKFVEAGAESMRWILCSVEVWGKTVELQLINKWLQYILMRAIVEVCTKCFKSLEE